jgi:hypothetical protein
MRSTMAAVICCAASTCVWASASPGPNPTNIAPGTSRAIAAPQDRAYPGEIRIAVDASDVDRRIVRVHETLTGIGADTVLLYPQWLPGTHAPEGPIDRFAGLRISANGAPVIWKRDPLDVYAFHVYPAAGIKSIDIDFEYLSPTSTKVADMEISRDVLFVEWNSLILYPAGYFARQIPVQASLTLPLDWKYGSALEVQSASGAQTTFKRLSLETLIDSPVYAGRYASRLDLDPGGAVPVHLDLFGLSDGDANRHTFIVPLGQQSVCNLDRFAALDRREMQHRPREMAVVPRHQIVLNCDIVASQSITPFVG